jgi:4-alpha-glucanotransferase
LQQLPFLASYPELQNKLSSLRHLNESQRVQYREVYDRKFAWLKEYFETVKPAILQDPDFLHFMETDRFWLEPYALFKVLKSKWQQSAWVSWPEKYRSPSKNTCDELLKEHQEDILFYSSLQYLCFTQLKSVKTYANVKGVFLKGDIPILINSDSVDVWAHPDFFDLTMAAGSPPDIYHSEGQYWGFPLFNWEAMRRFTENFGWWKARLRYAEHFYDLFRIDHIVGFFRMWSIPLNRSPKEGRYLPEDPSLWIPQGREILSVIDQSSHMLPIGEDLGSVPIEVKECLHLLGICGTKIVRWERRWDAQGSFIPYAEYPMLSMTSLSTHDSETLQLWWRNYTQEAQAFAHFKGWTYSPTLTFAQQQEMLRDSHHTPSLFHINILQDYLSLFSELVWPDPQEERINIPGTLSPFNWTYRFRLPITDIVAHSGLRKAMSEIIKVIY